MERYVKNYHDRLNTKNKNVRERLIDVKRDRKVPKSHEKRILESDILQCAEKLKKFKRLSSLKWNIYFFKSELGIENNYPHTHWNVIFIPYEYYFTLQEKNRITLLLHEQIHVYQRMFPIPFNHLLINIHSLKVSSLIESHPSFGKVRANPDVNNIIYKHPDNTYQIELFNHESRTLADSQTHTFDMLHEPIPDESRNQYEHPYEEIAYILSDALYSNNVKLIRKYSAYL